MRKTNYFRLVLSALLIGQMDNAYCQQINRQEIQQKKNVLFLIVDDLRSELNCYGVHSMHTPFIDTLAQNGVLFRNAYCNIPVSGASRASIMTGLRPTLHRWWDVNARIDKQAPNALTLPQYFKDNGYITISNSKVIHGRNDRNDSWTSIWKPEGKSLTWRDYLGNENLYKESEKHGPDAFECLDVADDAYFDGKTVNKTIQDLRKLKNSDKPFFLAVGLLKPHLPFNAPKKYWDLYAADSVKLPANYVFDRTGFPGQAFHTWNELRYYKNVPDKGDVNKNEALNLIRGYKACVSYSDAQVGKILLELKHLGLDKNTVVVLIGDHGWSLGEHDQWCKHSNFDIVTSAPLIFSIPGQPKGKKVDKIVEFVDLFPTICDVAGLPIPPICEGTSMMKLISSDDAHWKNCAIVKWHFGVTCVTPQYSYTEWRDKEDTFQANMLFDHSNDPRQNTNVANVPDYKDAIAKLSKEIMNRRGKDFLNN